ncbi:YfjI family protein [Vibrio sp. 1F263]|uniref:YfjI family protein n=1 Tax=Vibrio sp. 1F263 TaxID=3230012 RepID=UPI00352F9233
MRQQRQIYFPVNCEIPPNVAKSDLIAKAFNEAADITQAPSPMVYLTTISAVSVALQGLINVELPTGKIAPVSLMSLSIAESGERKSSVENLLTKGIKLFHRENMEHYQSRLKEYAIRSRLHDKKKAQIEKSIDLDEAYDELVNALIAHDSSKPKKPVLDSLIFEDSTIEALLSDLSEHIPNAYLGSSEGGVLLNSRIMSQTANLNSIWSGDEITVSRKSVGSFTVGGARLTMNIMTQWSALDRFMNKTKGDVRGNGFLSRFLVCAPESNCGFRQSYGIDYSEGNLNRFNERLHQLLSQSAALSGYTNKRTVSFSNEAKKAWFDIANHIELEMGPDGAFEHAKDHASKLPENIARLAALVHSFDNLSEEEISLDTLLEAIDLVAYFSKEFMKVFSAPPKYVVDADNLYFWFCNQSLCGVRYIKRNDLLQYGPNGTRKKKDLDLALGELRRTNNFKEVVIHRTRVIDLYPKDAFDAEQLKHDLSILIDEVL